MIPDDASMMDEPEIAAPLEQEPAVEQEDPLEATQLINKFEKDHVRPDDIRETVSEMPVHQAFVHTDANLPQVANGVATNYILKYQWIHQAMILAKDPAVSVRPKKKLGQLVPAVQLLITTFARTMEYLIQHSIQEIDLRSILDGAIQDVDTVGIVFIKLRWIEDLGRDPLGAWRPPDFQKTIRRMQRLQEGIANGDYPEGSAEYEDARITSEKLSGELEAEHWRSMVYPDKTVQHQPAVGPDGMPVFDQFGKPVVNPIEVDVSYDPASDPRKMRWSGMPTQDQISELPCFRGFVADVVDATDIVWDWRIKRPEFFHRSSHIDIRTWMTESEIREEFDLKADEPVVQHGGIDRVNEAFTAAGTRTDDDGGEAGMDAPKRRDSYAVWERQDRQRNMVYTWVQGSKKFLRAERKSIATSFWYDVFPIYFNRVSGRFLPVSNTTLAKPLQDEINTVRTHKRAAKRAAYNRYIVERDILGEGELDQLRACPPEGWVPTVKKVEDISKKIYQINGRYDPGVHDVIEERQELSSMMGIPSAATGQTKDASDSATEASIANQTSGQMGDRHRWMLEVKTGDLCKYMGEVLNQALPEENAKAIAGPDAYWPMVDRTALWQHLDVSIEAGSTGKPDKKDRLDSFQQSIAIGNSIGIGQPGRRPWDETIVLRRLADIMDWREDPDQLLAQMPVPLPPMPAGPVGGGSGKDQGPPPGPPPNEPPPPPGEQMPPMNIQQDPDAIPQQMQPPMPMDARVPGLSLAGAS